MGAPAAADLATGMPWQGVRWSIPLVGLLVYIWSVVTYSVALAQPAMIVAILGLLFLTEPLRVPPFLLALGAFLAWCTVGYYLTPFQGAVVGGLEVLAKVSLIALVLVNAVRDRRQQRLFMFVFLGAFALYPVRGALFNYFLGGYTTFGRALWNHIFANPNDLAAFCLLQLGLAAALLVREPRGWPKLAALVGLAMLPFVILLTQSRGGFVALATFGIGALALQPPRRRLRALGGVAVIALAIVPFAPQTVWDRIAGLRNATDTSQLDAVDAEGSARQRFEILKVAVAIVREHPFAGIGLAAYPDAHYLYAQRSSFDPTARGNRDTHNTYLNVAAETGVVGFSIFGIIFFLAVRHAERARKAARAVLPRSAQQIVYLELGLLAFFVAGIFGSFAQLAFLYVHTALLWVVSTSVQADVESMTASRGSAHRPR